MPDRKYLVVGGLIVSSKDGQCRYVTASQLVRLYGVNPSLCILTDEINEAKMTQGMRDFDMMVLRPRSGGDYRLPDGSRELGHRAVPMTPGEFWVGVPTIRDDGEKPVQ